MDVHECVDPSSLTGCLHIDAQDQGTSKYPSRGPCSGLNPDLVPLFATQNGKGEVLHKCLPEETGARGGQDGEKVFPWYPEISSTLTRLSPCAMSFTALEPHG